MFLFLPQTQVRDYAPFSHQGAQWFYDKIVAPWFHAHEGEINTFIHEFSQAFTNVRRAASSELAASGVVEEIKKSVVKATLGNEPKPPVPVAGLDESSAPLNDSFDVTDDQAQEAAEYVVKSKSS